MVERRTSKLVEKLREKDIDLFLCVNIEGSNTAEARYFSGFTGSFCALVIGDDTRVIISDPRYYDQIVRETNFDLVKLENEKLEDVIGRIIPPRTRVGLNFSRINHSFFLRIEKKLEGVEFVNVEDVIDELRMVKDEIEVEKIRISARIARSAFMESLNYLKPGVKEREFSAVLEYEMKKKGAEKVAFETIVASGYRSALPHGRASEKVIETGELVVVDFGAVYDGYVSDLTRTVIVGEVPEEQINLLELVKEAQRRAIATAKAGMKGLEIDRVAREMIEKRGYGANFGHGLGHGLGLEVHESPRLSPKEERIVPAGSVVTVEPGIYIPGKFGVRIED
ncbi:MAG TPA: aminopeptidase P family protein, partial [Thermotogales bacterium]|nr:aminopeptidase P family protein [Thermotogales bacterium]